MFARIEVDLDRRTRAVLNVNGGQFTMSTYIDKILIGTKEIDGAQWEKVCKIVLDLEPKLKDALK